MITSYHHTNNTENISSSSVITIRVPDFIKEELLEISKSNHLTLNANIAQILTKYIEWEQFVNDSGFVYTNKIFLKQLFKKINEKEILEIAEKYCVDTLKTSMLYIHGDLNKNTFLKTLDSWLRTSHIPFRHLEKNNQEICVIQHGLGKKWSLYLSTVIETISHDLGYAVELKQESDTLSFYLKK